MWRIFSIPTTIPTGGNAFKKSGTNFSYFLSGSKLDVKMNNEDETSPKRKKSVER